MECGTRFDIRRKAKYDRRMAALKIKPLWIRSQ